MRCSALIRVAIGAMVGPCALGACQTPGPATFADLDRAYDWNLDDGDALASSFERDLRRLLLGRNIGDALQQLRGAGYDCETGEAHERHPDPLSVCTKSFATRACQLDWRAELQPEQDAVRSVDAGFSRDCVGVNRDFPGEQRSAIDDQLTPMKP
ncbi:MAG: hypothetical protein ABL957_05200 [Parvularculaceae bacterium]